MNSSLYGKPLGDTNTTAYVAETISPFAFPGWAYVVGILIAILICITYATVFAGIYRWRELHQRRSKQRPKQSGEKGAKTEETAGCLNGWNSIVSDLSPAYCTGLARAPKIILGKRVAGVRFVDTDAVLRQMGSSWSMMTLRAWAEAVPLGLSPFEAHLDNLTMESIMVWVEGVSLGISPDEIDLEAQR